MMATLAFNELKLQLETSSLFTLTLTVTVIEIETFSVGATQFVSWCFLHRSLDL